MFRNTYLLKRATRSLAHRQLFADRVAAEKLNFGMIFGMNRLMLFILLKGA
jgi:hypothetical protein